MREGDDDELRVGNDGRPLLLPDLLQNKHAAELFTGWCIISDNLCSYMQGLSPPGGEQRSAAGFPVIALLQSC